MHLAKRPTYFVKNGIRKAVYYTVDARQLAETGWVPEGGEPESVKVDKIPVQVTTPEPQPETEVKPEASAIDLTAMTKVELVGFAKEQNIEIDPYALKSTILETIEGAIGD